MNAIGKSAIALGAVSFAMTLWVLKGGSDDPPSPAAPQRTTHEAPQPATHEAPRDVPRDFESAVRAAERTGSTPEGLKYQDAAGPELARVLDHRLSSCLTGASAVGKSAFAIVIGVAPDGTVTSPWASPETPLASCVLHRLVGAVLPPPPIPDVWIAANITPDAAASEVDPER